MGSAIPATGDPIIDALIAIIVMLLGGMGAFWKFVYQDQVASRKDAERREQEIRKDIRDILVPMIATVQTLSDNSKETAKYVTQLNTITLMQRGMGQP